ncbi:hypothetical protein EJB05_56819, partial [Eragrostis curvula]
MPTISASTIVGATGHHLFRINYPQSKEVPSGECLLSDAFKVGECSWRIWLSPNGIGPSSVGYISVFLGLDETVVKPLKASAMFCLLDKARNRVPNYTQCTTFWEYSATGIGGFFEYFAQRERLEKSDHIGRGSDVCAR